MAMASYHKESYWSDALTGNRPLAVLMIKACRSGSRYEGVEFIVKTSSCQLVIYIVDVISRHIMGRARELRPNQAASH